MVLEMGADFVGDQPGRDVAEVSVDVLPPLFIAGCGSQRDSRGWDDTGR